MEDHSGGAVGLAVTGGSLAAAWLAEIDLLLRILLTLVGITAGVYSILYYRHRWLRERNRE